MQVAVLNKPVKLYKQVPHFKNLNDYIQADAGTKVFITHQASNGAQQIMYEGCTNWVHKDFLKEVREIEES